MSLGSPPRAEGDLRRTPFAHLLVYMADRQLTGTLLLEEPSGTTHEVLFLRGIAAKTRCSDRFALLGELLVEAGVVSEKTVAQALQMAGLLGDVLLFTGDAEPADLEWAAEDQFWRRLIRLFSLPSETSYRYSDEDTALLDWGGPARRAHVLRLLAAGLRAHPRAGYKLSLLMERLGESRLLMHPDASLDRFCWNEDERVVVDWIVETGGSLTDLLAEEAIDADVARRVVYLLLITRQLDLGQKLPPLFAEDSGSQISVARVALVPTLHRAGAAAPDPAGDGERGAIVPRTLRRRRLESFPPDALPSVPETFPPPSGTEEEPISDIIEIGGPDAPGPSAGATRQRGTGSAS